MVSEIGLINNQKTLKINPIIHSGASLCSDGQRHTFFVELLKTITLKPLILNFKLTML